MSCKGLRIVIPLFAVSTFVGLVCDVKVLSAAALLLMLMTLYCFIGVLWVKKTMAVDVDMSEVRVHRGDNVDVTVTFSNGCFLPGMVVKHSPAEETIEDDVFPLKRSFSRPHPYHAEHVGMAQVSMGEYEVSDFLGIFSCRCAPKEESSSLLVLPRTFDLDELAFSPGDSGLETISRATEDVSNPTDIRGYQPGDPLKKIHWKLSLRKRELMVRRFEEPVLQEAVVLLDCSSPAKAESGEKTARIRDTLLETAASVMNQQCRTENSVVMPLFGKFPMEIGKEMGMAAIAEDIARCNFSQEESFERVLLLETRRMRKVGAAVVISSHLNGSMVDVMASMRRMGPTVRFYYVSYSPDSPELVPMIGKLQMSGVEVCYVTPAEA